MTRLKFEYEFVNKHAKTCMFPLTEEWTAVKKKRAFLVWNEKTNEMIKYKTLDEFLNHKIGDSTIWELIEPRETVVPELILN